MTPKECSRRPTQSDVARRAGVSRALVSLVFRDAPNVAEHSRERVLRAAAELDYRPNAAARSLARRDNRTVGVFVHDVTNPHVTAVFTAFARSAERAGLELLVSNGSRTTAKEPALLDTLLEHQVAALVLLSPTMREATLRQYSRQVPTVVIGREAHLTGVDVVTIDEHHAASLALDHLMDLGHRRIAHITGGNDNRPGADRAGAYRAAMKERGLEPIVVPGAFTIEGGRAGARAVVGLAERPTAVVAANDLVAAAALGHFRAIGLDVPGDISVLGYDNSQVARLEIADLTTIDQQVDRFGALATEILRERMSGSRHGSRIERVESQLIVRSTTGSAPGP